MNSKTELRVGSKYSTTCETDLQSLESKGINIIFWLSQINLARIRLNKGLLKGEVIDHCSLITIRIYKT